MKFDPYVGIRLFTRTNMAAIGDAALNALTQDPALAPERFGLDQPFPVDLAGARRLWRDEAARQVGLVDGERRQPFRVSFHATLAPTHRQPFNTIFWAANPRALARVGAGRIEALFLRLVAATDPFWAAGYHSADFERQNVFRNRPNENGVVEPYRIVGLQPDKAIPGLYWLNYFGPELCAARPALADARSACGAVPHGKGLLLKLAEDPMQMLLPEVRQRVRQCKQALGKRLFFDRRRPFAHDD